MKYLEIRDQIKTGDLIAWSHRSWRTWYDFQIQLVRIFTRSEYSHIALAYVVRDRVFVIEAVGSGVRIFPLSDQLPFYWISNPKPYSDYAINWLLAQVGIKYASKLMMVWSFITGKKLRDDNRWQCSELVNVALLMNAQDLLCDDTPSASVEAAMHRWPAGLKFLEN